MRATQRLIMLSGFDPVVTSWVNAGGSASYGSLKALDDFVKGCKQDATLAAVRRMNWFIGSFGSVGVPQIALVGNSTDTLINFVSGDYSEAGGLTGNGTNKYIDTGYVPSEATGGIGAYPLSVGAGSVGFAGSRNSPGTQIFRLVRGSSPTREIIWGGTNSVTIAGDITAPCFLYGQRTSPTNLVLYQDAAALGSGPAATTPASTGFSLFVFSYNIAGVPQLILPGTLAGYVITDGSWTSNQESIFRSRLRTFQLALGRNA